MLSNARKELVSRNTQVIKSLLKCVAFCGKQGLSFRGHRDDSTASASDNTGNFVHLVQFRDDVLRTYLETAPRNALYTSKSVIASSPGPSPHLSMIHAEREEGAWCATSRT